MKDFVKTWSKRKALDEAITVEYLINILKGNTMNFELKFRGVDDWSRPVFKAVDKKIYFGSTEVLVPDERIGLVDEKSIVRYFRDHTDKLEYFGTSFDCEPNGGRSVKWKFTILD